MRRLLGDFVIMFMLCPTAYCDSPPPDQKKRAAPKSTPAESPSVGSVVFGVFGTVTIVFDLCFPTAGNPTAQ